jgi:hypothetical protein
VGAVNGDIENLMRHRQAWHRVTVYGNLEEPLKELSRRVQAYVRLRGLRLTAGSSSRRSESGFH